MNIKRTKPTIMYVSKIDGPAK
jgi:hypothetical protein